MEFSIPAIHFNKDIRLGWVHLSFWAVADTDRLSVVVSNDLTTLQGRMLIGSDDTETAEQP